MTCQIWDFEVFLSLPTINMKVAVFVTLKDSEWRENSTFWIRMKCAYDYYRLQTDFD